MFRKYNFNFAVYIYIVASFQRDFWVGAHQATRAEAWEGGWAIAYSNHDVRSAADIEISIVATKAAESSKSLNLNDLLTDRTV